MEKLTNFHRDWYDRKISSRQAKSAGQQDDPEESSQREEEPKVQPAELEGPSQDQEYSDFEGFSD